VTKSVSTPRELGRGAKRSLSRDAVTRHEAAKRESGRDDGQQLDD
jgi:hypothetical protein